MDKLPTSVFDADDPRGEFPFAPEQYIVHLLTVITRYRDAQLERLLKPLDLTVALHRALLVILRFEPCTMTEFADFSIVERTTLTRTVDQLVARGLAVRISRTGDRRTVQLSTTEAGKALQSRAAVIIQGQNREDLKGIPEDVIRSMVRGAQMYAANMAPDAVARERALTFRRKDPGDP